jgi:hypothetical protein
MKNLAAESHLFPCLSQLQPRTTFLLGGTPLLHIWEIPESNPGPETSHPD